MEEGEIAYNEKWKLSVPAYEPRLLADNWFHKTFTNIGREMCLALQHSEKKRTCVQAGSCFGIYPKYLSRYYDKVITFEPNPTLYKCTLLNTADQDNITAIRAALGDEPGTKILHQAKCGGDSLVPDGQEHKKISYPVNVIKLDSLELTDVDFIQLDIERYEAFALEGARETIDRCKPVIQVEIHKHSAKEIDRKLNSLGYKMKDRAGSRDALYLPIQD